MAHEPVLGGITVVVAESSRRREAGTGEHRDRRRKGRRVDRIEDKVGIAQLVEQQPAFARPAEQHATAHCAAPVERCRGEHVVEPPQVASEDRPTNRCARPWKPSQREPNQFQCPRPHDAQEAMKRS